MTPHTLSGPLQRFPGPTGWYYLPLPEALDPLFRPLVQARWPALVGVRCTVGATTWDGSIMPIRGGPLFLAFPARVRSRESLEVGTEVTVSFVLRS